MAINYKKEVDSGYDRKLMVEKLIYELVKRGIPVEEIENDSNFIKIRHSELVNNISRGYESKLEQVEKLYGGFYEYPEDGLSEGYSELYHGMKELYPLTPEEEKAIFIKRDLLKKELKKEDAKFIKKLAKEREKYINKIAAYKLKNRVLDKILALTNEMDILIQENKLDPQTVKDLFKKYDLNQNKYPIYEKIYREYMSLNTNLETVTNNLELANRGLLHSEDCEKKSAELKAITEEIVSRNIKLINGFIRQRYGTLLVEQEDLFSLCLEALYKSIEEFDVKIGTKLSTFAYKYMDTEIKSRFKELTGYKWGDYWRKQKLSAMIEIVSEALGKQANIIDLYELGLIDMSLVQADIIHNHLPIVMLESYVYGDPKANEQLADPEYDESAILDDYEDNKYKDNYVEEEEITSPGELEVLKVNINEGLNVLTEREKIVIILRYGLEPYKYLDEEVVNELLKEDNVPRPRSLSEVGNILNLTAERIRQIERKSLRKLQRPLKKEKIRGYI